MNIKLFRELMEQPPAQHPAEWLMFLELCETYLIKHNIDHPVVVELGILHGRQKPFYEQLFGAEYIGIDITDKRAKPDILGDTHAPQTMQELHRMLYGRKIDILYIDACHTYEAVKEDFEKYSLLCDGIIGFNDVETARYRGRHSHQVWKFWDELRDKSFIQTGEYANFLFLTIHQCRFKKKRDSRLGTGVMIKR